MFVAFVPYNLSSKYARLKKPNCVTQTKKERRNYENRACSERAFGRVNEYSLMTMALCP